MKDTSLFEKLFEKIQTEAEDVVQFLEFIRENKQLNAEILSMLGTEKGSKNIALQQNVYKLDVELYKDERSAQEFMNLAKRYYKTYGGRLFNFLRKFWGTRLGKREQKMWIISAMSWAAQVQETKHFEIRDRVIKFVDRYVGDKEEQTESKQIDLDLSA